jgi:molecular chaperone HscB
MGSKRSPRDHSYQQRPVIIKNNTNQNNVEPSTMTEFEAWEREGEVEGTVFQKCWNCSSQHQCNLFCPACAKVQQPVRTDLLEERNQNGDFKPMRTHFELFALGRVAYKIDEQQLDTQYKKLQMLLHPDKFACKSEMERKISLIQSTLITQAYQILKNPRLRIEYMLSLVGEQIEENDVEPDFLGHMMEVMEMLNEEEHSQSDLRSLLDQNNVEREAIGNEFNDTYLKKDWVNAKRAAAKLNYLLRIRDTIYEMIEINDVSSTERGIPEVNLSSEREEKVIIEPNECKVPCAKHETCVHATYCHKFDPAD